MSLVGNTGKEKKPAVSKKKNIKEKKRDCSLQLSSLKVYESMFN